MNHGRDEPLLGEIEALLQQGDESNPLHAPLQRLLAHHIEQLAKLDRQFQRLVRVSDRYQNMLQEANQALHQASTHDLLTGLANRRHVMERLVAQTARLGPADAYCVAMVDIDRFKHINDSHGHLAGDSVLQGVSARLKGLMRTTDLCGRWGGEEFLLLLPGSTLGDALHSLERVRSGIAETPIPWADGDIAVTASFGTAQWQHGEAISQTLKRADDALLRAKRQGRNRIEQGDVE